MKIFISYGHDCKAFVEKIRNDLVSAGHDVWMDFSDIYQGDDWRNAIAEGILGSQAVLVFLSSHSLRKESVCHDEISISVACKRRIVRPILMEAGIEPLIPAIIKGIQFFDFSGWEQALSDDSLYQQKLQQIISELERISKDPYDEQMSMLRLALRPKPDGANLLRELQKPYFSRGWLVNRLNNWIDSAHSHPFLLIGFPGSGKSRFCIQYSRLSPLVISLTVCEWDTSSTSKILCGICYQIAAHITSFRNRLIWLINTNAVSVNSVDASELFDNIIIEPFLYEINGQHEPLIIILDGIDALTKDENNALARLIAEKRSLLPPFVHFLLTARKDSSVMQYFPDACSLEIRPKDPDVHADILTFLDRQLNNPQTAVPESRRPFLIHKIADVCVGSFLLASLISQGFSAGEIDLDANDVIPDSVYALYCRWMERLVTGGEYAEKYYGAFSILSAVDFPVSLALLKKALGWNNMQVQSFIRKFKSFLIEETGITGDRTLALFHDSFRIWLSDEEGIAGIYSVSSEDGASQIAKAALEAFRNGELSDMDTLRLWRCVSLSGSQRDIQAVLTDDSYLLKLVDLASKYIRDVICYSFAEDLLDLCRDLCAMRERTALVEYLAAVRIPIIQSIGLFEAGDFSSVEILLKADLKDIGRVGKPMDLMESLYMLGTACDMLGKRRESADLFNRLIHIAESENNPRYRYRALVGLIWNDHFTNMASMAARMSELSPESASGEDRTTCSLVYARALLAQGKLGESLELFSKTLAASDTSGIWGFSPLAVRNQMLLIEAVVACYDNEEYEKGVRYGLHINEHLSAGCSITECYCNSWIAMNYMMLGNLAEADRHLLRAETINRETNTSPNSSWITMHLLSVRAFWFTESGRRDEALQYHEQVTTMAEECSDPWVLGDAYFEMILLYLDKEAAVQAKAKALALQKVSADSGLPHLLLKNRLITNLLSGHTDPEELRAMTEDVLQNRYPSTNELLALSLCARIAERENNPDLCSRIREKMKNKIADISRRNPGGAYENRSAVRKMTEDKHS